MEATEIRMKKGEPIDRALRRLKKKLDKEGTLKELRNRRHFEKPSEKKRKNGCCFFYAEIAEAYGSVIFR